MTWGRPPGPASTLAVKVSCARSFRSPGRGASPRGGPSVSRSPRTSPGSAWHEPQKTRWMRRSPPGNVITTALFAVGPATPTTSHWYRETGRSQIFAVWMEST